MKSEWTELLGFLLFLCEREAVSREQKWATFFRFWHFGIFGTQSQVKHSTKSLNIKLLSAAERR
jgi:hypothetical protein